jgi:hypothetical protein
MPKSTENLILEHLAPMRAAVDPVEQRLDDMTIRIGHLETSFAHEQSIVSRPGSRGSKKGLNCLMGKVPG